RSPVAAQSVASCAARLGVCSVRTAVSEAEVMARLAEQPAELILVDTAVSRPDTVGFTRRVLAQDPRAVLLLFGAEDPKVAAATVAAGARGIIRGGDHDPVGTVAKALLLIAAARATADSAGAPALSAVARAARKPVAPAPAGVAAGVGGSRHRPGGRQPEVGPDNGDAGVLVPAQRGDVLATDGLGFVPIRLRTPLTEREVQVLRGMAEGKS